MSRRTAGPGVWCVFAGAIAVFCGGCGTTVGMIDAPWMKLGTLTDTKDKVYIGARLDYAIMTEPRSNGGGGGSLSGVAGLIDLSARVIWIPDLLVSAACDSLLLPLTLQARSSRAGTPGPSESPRD